MNEFGRRLKRIREEKGLTHQELGEAIGSTKSHMWKYENKDIDPGLKMMIKIADHLGVTLDWLAGNGDIDDIQFANKEQYLDVINQAIREKITPDKLGQIIKIFKE